MDALSALFFLYVPQKYPTCVENLQTPLSDQRRGSRCLFGRAVITSASTCPKRSGLLGLTGLGGAAAAVGMVVDEVDGEVVGELQSILFRAALVRHFGSPIANSPRGRSWCLPTTELTQQSRTQPTPIILYAFVKILIPVQCVAAEIGRGKDGHPFVIAMFVLLEGPPSDRGHKSLALFGIRALEHHRFGIYREQRSVGN